MEPKRYKVLIAESGKKDIREKKKYILKTFKYRAYAEGFSQKIKKAVMQLDIFPVGYDTTGFSYRGYEIYIKPYHSYLLFYTVDENKNEVTVLRVLQDREDWQFIITEWLFAKKGV